MMAQSQYFPAFAGFLACRQLGFAVKKTSIFSLTGLTSREEAV
jgi:hypothetical protein